MTWYRRFLPFGRRPHPQYNKKKLSIEQLEIRACLAAPVISALNVSQGSSHYVYISGHVADESPGNIAIAISGVISGQTSTMSNGDFYVFGMPSALGAVSITATDVENLASTVAAAIVSEAPTIAISDIQESGYGKAAIIHGIVHDDFVSTCAVTVGGVASGTVMVGFDGAFTAYANATSLGQINFSVSDEWGQTSTTSVNLTSQVPALSNVQVVGSSYGKYVIVTGHVLDSAASQSTVTLGGICSGQLSVDYNGNFSAFAAATSVGNLTITATDVWGQSSPASAVAFTDAAPSLSDVVVTKASTGKQITVTGHVSDALPGYARVNLSGVATATASVNTDGSFSITTTAQSLGQISLQAKDVWDQYSASVTADVQSSVPAMSALTVRQESGSYWTIEGAVSDDQSVVALVIAFGGVLQGTTITTGSGGTFSYTFSYTGSSNLITAATQDWWGQLSNTSSCIIA